MDDEEILEQFSRTGDNTLLEELIRRHFDRIYRFVGSMVGKREGIDDIVQDVLLSVVRNIDRFRGNSALTTWIYRIASRRVYRHLEMTRKAVPTVDAEHAERIAAKEDTTPESREMKNLLDEAIKELSPALRTAILLTTVEGLSPEEAADVEGCTTANIHWRIHKARKILKERLKKYFD